MKHGHSQHARGSPSFELDYHFFMATLCAQILFNHITYSVQGISRLQVQYLL